MIASTVDDGASLPEGRRLSVALAGFDPAVLGFTKALLQDASLDNIDQVLSRGSAAHRRLQRR